MVVLCIFYIPWFDGGIVMFCRKCGSEIPDGSKFCIKCGAMTTAQNGSVPPTVLSSQGGTYTANNVNNGIQKSTLF